MAARAFMAAVVAALIGASGCALVPAPPGPTTTDARLAAFPTTGLDVASPTVIRWSGRQVPFVDAQSDADAAYAMGLAHAHLRLGQMAVVRRLLQGRLSESAGPFAADLDIALRAFDFDRVSSEIHDQMPPEPKLWLDRFAQGVNDYAARLPDDALPHEFELLAIDWEPWTPEDSITIGRAAGVDVNWFAILSLLSIEDPAARQRVFERAERIAFGGETTFQDGAPNRDEARAAPQDVRTLASEAAALKRVAALSALFPRTGSNSFVVGPERSATGAPIIANDPHLGFLIPNPWLIAGLKSPSFSMVGMMVPGTPVFAFGRNERIAWGGTNLRATTSQLVDVSSLPPEAFETIEERVGVRFWFDRDARYRRTAYGPVMSELPPLPTAGGGGPAFAVRWMGHTVSDEISALHQAMAAQTVGEFRAAMADFALPPQTFLVAEASGAIAGVIAAKVPARPEGDPLRLLVDPETSDAHWDGFARTPDFPVVIDPPEGFLASANNRPTRDESRPYTGFFPQDERIRRLRALVGAETAMTVARAGEIQRDTVSPLSLSFREAIAPALADWTPRSAAERGAVAEILSWDGDYAAESRGALVFEALLVGLGPAAYGALGRPEDFEAFAARGVLRMFLPEDLALLTPAQRAAAIGAGVAQAAETFETGQTWGDVHRLEVAHVFGDLPLIGSRYLIEDIPIGGSRETIFKTSHPLTVERHDADFGAQSRHISDLSDPDANYFVLFGGQDGWLGSPNFADQVSLWREGGFVQVPLTEDAVRRAHPIVLRLAP